MKLQVNLKGSWRDIVTFEAERAPEVEDAAASLARASGFHAMRVMDDDQSARYLTARGTFRALHEEDEEDEEDTL